RDGTSERYSVTSDEIDAWYARLQMLDASLAEQPYTTGAHCTYCPRAADCPAQREDLRRAMVAIDGDGSLGLDVSKLDGDTVARVHRKLKMLANVKEKWDLAIKNRIRENGPIDLGDGYQLAIVTENGKREIDALKAWPAMSSRLTDEELAPCLRVSVTALESAVATKAQKAKPRSGAEAKRALAVELEAAGAITKGTVDKLKEVRIQNVPETKEIAQ
ncbi:MAG TPA: hypothetical protein VKO87_10915, partial [Gemmatimonadaceae bacterium]|nr:hypothetical protein [Gemmatimonadaceae bacterium]